MKPEIRYARTSDGVSIAFWSIGSGPTLIDIPAPPGDHIERIWDIDEYREGMTDMAKLITLVKYDSRGFGLSERNIERFSIDAMVADLEAVVDALNLRRFVLNGWVMAAIPAIAYAARHPERVIALVLREGMSRGTGRPNRYESLMELARTDWDAACRVFADSVPNVLTIASLRQLNEMIHATSTQETFVRFNEQWREWDVSDLLPEVVAPVLVTNDGIVGREETERLAAALPNASLVAHQPMRGDLSPTEDSVNAFLRRVFTREYAPRETTAHPRTAGAGDGRRLTPRELEVLQLLANGRSNRQIAEDLVLSERTVVRHIANIYGKIDAHGRAEATAYAVRHGVV